MVVALYINQMKRERLLPYRWKQREGYAAMITCTPAFSILETISGLTSLPIMI